MNFDFLDRRSAERFAELLDEINGGRRHHTRGQADEELAELVAIGHSLSAARSGVQVDSEFRDGLRAMLVATAERDGIGAGAADTATGVHAGVREPGRGLFRKGSGRRIRARGAIVISVAAGAMAVSGISAASENASPGDALYGVKRSTERAQLAMAGSDVSRGQLSLGFARTRLAEAAAMPGDGSFGTVLSDMDADTRQGVKLLTSSAVARKDVAPLSTVDGFVTSQRSVFQPILGKLSPANRERAAASMSLLDDVQQRAEDLRGGLACDTISRDGTDTLGPKLGDCLSGSGSSSTGRPQGTNGKQGAKSGDSSQPGTDKVRPERTDPTAGVTGPAAPGAGEPDTPTADPSDATPGTGQTTAPADGDDGDDGVVGGILGGILGG